MNYFSRRAWHIFVLRILPFSNVTRQNLLYLFKDPWALTNDRETFRITKTSEIIEKNFGHVNSIIEIGCAEGAQSKFLRTNCEHLSGVDISGLAIRRAKRHVPDAEFFVTNVFEKGSSFSQRASLVVACEMIYLLDDILSAIKRLEELGSSCLVTYMDAASAKMATALEGRTLKGKDKIEHDGLVWHVVWWDSACT